MRSLACMLLVACAPPPSRAVVVLPVADSSPDPAPIVAPPTRGPAILPLQSFTVGSLETSSEPAFTAGTVRPLRRLSTVGTIYGAVFDAQRRVVIGTGNRWWLVDPIDDRVIAEVGKPHARLSENELVVRRGNRDAVIDLRDGRALVPEPRIPIAAPIETTYIVHANEQDGSDWYAVERAEAGADVFVIAIAGGRRFVGSWNDRVPRPRLDDEIEETESGWRAVRRDDGLELRYGIPKACKALRLHRARAPECIAELDDSVNAGSWHVRLEQGRLLAHDLATGRDEVVELACKHQRIDGRSLDTPRVVVDCDDTYVAWTPGTARVLHHRDETLPHYVLFGRLPALITDVEIQGNELGHRWIDLDAGTVWYGPTMANLSIDRDGERIVALRGSGLAIRAAVIDAARGTVRDAGALPCRGEILLDETKGDYTALSCGIADRPGKFDFARVWSKIIDTRSAKVYDLPGYPSALFADGTVILSNRTRLTAETIGPNATMTVAKLE